MATVELSKTNEQLFITGNFYALPMLYRRPKNNQNVWDTVIAYIGVYRCHGDKEIDVPVTRAMLSPDYKMPHNYGAYSWTETGREGGKIKVSDNTEGKIVNAGRSNEKNPLQERISTLSSYYRRMKKNGYHMGRKDIVMSTNPMAFKRYNAMLALDFRKRKNVIYPVLVQPKYDGFNGILTRTDMRTIPDFLAKIPSTLPVVRSEYEARLASTHACEVVIYTRSDNFILGQRRIKYALDNLFREYPTLYVNGEFLLPGQSHQQLRSAAKSMDIDLNFVLFDIFFSDNLSMVLIDRLDFINKVIVPYVMQNGLTFITFPLTFEARDEGEVMSLFRKFRDEGFEGAMVKAVRGTYETSLSRGVRSPNMLKVKERDDGEFLIVGSEAGSGKFAHVLIWHLETEQGGRFTATDGGNMAEKAAMFDAVMENPQKYYGHYYAKVAYVELTDGGIPREPIVLFVGPLDDMH